MRLVAGVESFCEAECTQKYMSEQKLHKDALMTHSIIYGGETG